MYIRAAFLVFLYSVSTFSTNLLLGSETLIDPKTISDIPDDVLTKASFFLKLRDISQLRRTAKRFEKFETWKEAAREAGHYVEVAEKRIFDKKHSMKSISRNGELMAKELDGGVVNILIRGVSNPIPTQKSEPGNWIIYTLFSSNGKYFANGKSGYVNVNKPNTLDPPLLLGPHVGPNESISALAFSHDSKWLASTSWDGTLKLWKLENNPGEEYLQHSVEGLEMLRNVIFSPDGRFLVTKSTHNANTHNESCIFRLWELPALRQIRELSTPETNRIIAFSPDGRFLVSFLKTDQRIQIWNIQNGTTKCLERLELESLPNLVFSPDGRFLLLGTENQIYILNFETGRIVNRIETICSSFILQFVNAETFIVSGNNRFLDVGLGAGYYVLYYTLAPLWSRVR